MKVCRKCGQSNFNYEDVCSSCGVPLRDQMDFSKYKDSSEVKSTKVGDGRKTDSTKTEVHVKPENWATAFANAGLGIAIYILLMGRFPDVHLAVIAGLALSMMSLGRIWSEEWRCYPLVVSVITFILLIFDILYFGMGRGY